MTQQILQTVASNYNFCDPSYLSSSLFFQLHSGFDVIISLRKCSCVESLSYQLYVGSKNIHCHKTHDLRTYLKY